MFHKSKALANLPVAQAQTTGVNVRPTVLTGLRTRLRNLASLHVRQLGVLSQLSLDSIPSSRQVLVIGTLRYTSAEKVVSFGHSFLTALQRSSVTM